MSESRTLNNEQETLFFGAQCAKYFIPGNIIFLQGELGAGKTTFVRGFLQGLGYTGNIKSPTYTIVEPYDFSWGTLYHFDLYRINDPKELEFMGIREYFDLSSLILIEWPERGFGLLPIPDLEIIFQHKKQGREALINPVSESGHTIFQKLISL